MRKKRKGAIPDSERTVILDDPYKLRVVNFKIYEYTYAVLQTKLVEEDITLSDLFRACIDSYLDNKTEVIQVLSDYFRNTKKVPHATHHKKKVKRLRKNHFEPEKRLIPPTPEKAAELYDVIEKKGS